MKRAQSLPSVALTFFWFLLTGLCSQSKNLLPPQHPTLSAHLLTGTSLPCCSHQSECQIPDRPVRYFTHGRRGKKRKEAHSDTKRLARKIHMTLWLEFFRFVTQFWAMWFKSPITPESLTPMTWVYTSLKNWGFCNSDSSPTTWVGHSSHVAWVRVAKPPCFFPAGKLQFWLCHKSINLHELFATE